MSSDQDSFARRAAVVEWLLCDVDGVLTDGHLYYGRGGETVKKFNVRDGLAVRLAQRAGLKVGLLSGRSSPGLERRAADLELAVVILGVRDKGAAFDEFLAAHRTFAERVAYVGDDLPDLAVLRRCGLSFAPADAAEEVRAVVHEVLTRAGGEGVVREIIERILKARGDWERLVAAFSAA